MRKRKLKRWVKVVIMLIIGISTLKAFTHDLSNVSVVEYNYTIGNTIPHYEPKMVLKTDNYTEYRLTYYFTGDNTNSTNITASGLKTSDFQINENGWYTYKGKLVVATANKRLLSWERYKNSTQRMFNLYDELILEINGVRYEAIVLDVCGISMTKPVIDLFVKDRASGIDTKIKLIE